MLTSLRMIVFVNGQLEQQNTHSRLSSKTQMFHSNFGDPLFKEFLEGKKMLNFNCF